MIEGNLERLRKLKSSLLEAGVSQETIESIEVEMTANESPPGFLGKHREKAKKQLAKNYRHLKGELFETSEVFSLLKERILNKKNLNAEETAKIREQMVDLVKMFPAGIFAALNTSLPVPGTALLTPFLLSKMKLLPSRWRDAHLIEKLREEGKILTERGRFEEAHQLSSLNEALDRQRARQESACLNANLLSEWDLNQNGKWDRSEKIAYRQELKRVEGILKQKAMVQNWYVRLGSETWGPFRIGKIMSTAPELDEDLLVCWAGKSGWVDVQDLYEGESQV